MAPEITEGDTIELVAQLRLNAYMNTVSVQLQIVDMRCLNVQLYDYRTKYFKPEFFDALNFQPIYFREDYRYPGAVPYKDVDQIHEHVLILDLPERLEDIRHITAQEHLSKLLVLFRTDDLFGEELLLRREHFVKSYAIYRQFKNFSADEPRLIRMLERSGITKNMHKLALQVFFELKFVIIKGKSVTLVDQPEKRDLSESPTFQNIQEKIKLKEKLTLSSTQALKQFLFSDND